MARTLHTAEFKKKVALEALREDKALAQIAQEQKPLLMALLLVGAIDKE